VTVFETPLLEAVITAWTEAATATEVNGKVAEVAPPATVTEAGTLAAGFELERVTAWPAGAAGPVRVTVPVRLLPPVTDAAKAIEYSAAGCTVTLTVFETPPLDAVMTAVTGEATTVEVSVNVVAEAPPGTVTEAGTTAAGFELERVTAWPAGRAGPVRVTVPVRVLLPVTEAASDME
jgi:hypothetical protein